MSGLDEKGLEAAKLAFASDSRVLAMGDNVPGALADAIRAYLAASAPPAPDGLVGRLHYAIEEAEFGHESPTHVRALVTHLKQAAAEIDRLQTTADAARENFLTMQGAANKLRIRAESAEAEVARLRKVVERAKEVIEPFADVPLNGTFGGPLCGAKALYEDGSDDKYTPDNSVLGHEPFRRARRFLEETK